MAFELREAITQALIKEGTELSGLINDRVFQSSSLAIQAARPFVVAKLGVVNAAGWRDGPTWRMGELWVHDEPGDYYTIDRIIELAKAAFHELKNEDNFLEARFVSVTPDLDDPELGTILRVARFQWALTN